MNGEESFTELGCLEDGPQFEFRDWHETPIPRGPVGVYTVWYGSQFLYVGMSWREPSGTSKGLWGRMNSHASGRRSGDQFCVYICDRYVIPTLSPLQLSQVGSGHLRLDETTRRFIRENLTYRYLLSESGVSARKLESHVRSHGLPISGHPLLNPAPRIGAY